MTDLADATGTLAPAALADAWLADFEAALAARDASAISALFAPSGTFRDLLATDWDIRHFAGEQEVGRRLARAARSAAVTGLRIRDTVDGAWRDASGATPAINAFVRFANDVGTGEGVIRLIEQDGSLVAANVVLELTELAGRPEAVGDRRPIGKVHKPVVGRPSWEDEVDADFRRADPQVVIVGAGHNGLMLAARLLRIGIGALVIERHGRVGDNWRTRYSALALHDPVQVEALPYLPFPAGWPTFTPGSKFGDFLESYATLLDIPVWTGARLGEVRYDASAGRWDVEVTRSDGERRTLRTGHLVVATGAHNKPRIPEVADRDVFSGSVVHATDFGGGASWSGKRAIVVGTGVSGHDIAQDLAEHGAEVTMLQRGATYVMNASTNHELSFTGYLRGERPIEDIDLMGQLVPYSRLPELGKTRTAIGKERDRETLEGLARAGFALTDGPGGAGNVGLVFGQNRHGYYFNIGASELIIEGRIAVRRGSIARFTRGGVVLDDGAEIPADLMVYATGYESVNESNRELLGDLVDELPPICTIGPDGEFAGIARHTGHDRLWFLATLGIPPSRTYSKLLAIQIAAIEDGLAPASR
ncbi:flavin-containing monooxygenase [Nocardia miyunensis]|uniref:flavin-containing monooxygenase n=1 Tax=Nocardia miyunensis TaxID=282684 RepID=UPI000834331E|nr:NAD(P)/FAD-dependent oxidoreductase [Nocardia miyunensis]